MYIIHHSFNQSFWSKLCKYSQCFSIFSNNKKYEVIKELKTWEDAAACAVQRDGYLTEITSQSENDSIFDAIINGAGISTSYTSVPDAFRRGAYVWIGATDKNEEGRWFWDGNNDNIGLNFWNGNAIWRKCRPGRRSIS